MVAYHFPPLAGSSGVQRTLRFVQHLPEFGWEPIVLSADPRAYERTDTDLDAEIPPHTVVRRAFALDTARHLAVRGRYVAAMARPDRWASWRFDGVRQGMRLIRDLRPDLLWSTYPIATAHVIGADLHRRSGIPWVADFRDPMAQDGHPADPATWARFKSIEESALRHACRCMFTTPTAALTYRRRYPETADRIVLLENGYDEDSFAAASADPAEVGALTPGRITLLHSGIVYPRERDPTPLFVALQRLKEAGRLSAEAVTFRFRAPVHADLLQQLAARHDVADLIEVCPLIGYREALREMLRADALLVLQGASCNEQIPAKIYEYLRARRPTLCLADPAGDTAGVLREWGIDAIAALESSDDIAALLPPFLASVASSTAALPTLQGVKCASREARTMALADEFDRAISAPAAN
jgi:hypothetical protein